MNNTAVRFSRTASPASPSAAHFSPHAKWPEVISRTGRRAAGLLLLAGVVLGAAAPAQAATATGTMNVSAFTNGECRVASANSIDFGLYDSTGTHRTATLRKTATLTVQCVKYGVNNPVRVSLASVNQASGSCLSKRMIASGNYLPYTVYRDSGYTQNWGCVSDSNSNLISAAALNNGAVVTLTMYGQIGAGVSVPAGAYQDTINVNLSF